MEASLTEVRGQSRTRLPVVYITRIESFSACHRLHRLCFTTDTSPYITLTLTLTLSTLNLPNDFMIQC